MRCRYVWAGPQDTCDHIIGADALRWGWWEVTGSHGVDYRNAPDGWFVDVVEVKDSDAGEYGVTVRVDHETVMRAVNTLARTAEGNRPDFMSTGVLRECSTFLKDPDDADFDADLADQVLQYIAFGKIVYG